MFFDIMKEGAMVIQRNVVLAVIHPNIISGIKNKFFLGNLETWNSLAFFDSVVQYISNRTQPSFTQKG